ncbi:MAG: radical SAM protein [Candidatus Bathyarchaeia archaeon]
MWRLIRPDAALALEERGVKEALPRYVGIVEGRRLAKFMIARSMPAEFEPDASTTELWKAHEKILKDYLEWERLVDEGEAPGEVEEGPSFLDLKIEIAKRIMMNCHFCVRRCGVDRLSGGRGYCRCGAEFRVSTCFPHMGEEPELVPSGTVFTCGCTIRCLHCQNWEISQWVEEGEPADPSKMARIVEGLRRQGCRNLNMVGGEPTPNTWLWLRTLREVKVNLPTVWNSNSYYSEETSNLLSGLIDVYLLDFKYGNNACAEAISDAPGYWEATTRNHLSAKRYGELIIRVLVLPGHNECCTRPILNWISKNLGPMTRVNLMFQYRPEYRAYERTELRRRLTQLEMAEARRIAEDAGLRNLVE